MISDNTIVDLNDSISLIGIDQKDNFQNYSLVHLVIRNSTNKNVIFPGDYNIAIFGYIDGEWVNMNNCMTYSTNEISVPPIKEFPLGDLISVLPCTGTVKESIPVRIEISGKLNNLLKTSVGAYYEIELIP